MTFLGGVVQLGDRRWDLCLAGKPSASTQRTAGSQHAQTCVWAFGPGLSGTWQKGVCARLALIGLALSGGEWAGSLKAQRQLLTGVDFQFADFQ